MVDDQLLSAIGNLMDQKLEPIHKEIKDMKSDIFELKEDVVGLKEDVKGLNSRITRVEVILENDISKQINILAEGHMDNAKRIEQISEDVSDMKEKISVLYTISQRNVREIRRLSRVK